MKNTRSHSNYKKPFYTSLAVTLIVLFLLGGLLVTDYRCRSTAFGETPQLLAVSQQGEKTFLNIDTLGVKADLDVSAGARAWNFIREFICVPSK